MIQLSQDNILYILRVTEKYYKMDFVLASSGDADEMPHAAFLSGSSLLAKVHILLVLVFKGLNMHID